MKKLETFKRHLKKGEVYRRNDLEQWSTAVDRHLQALVKDGTLEKLAGGLYYVPNKTAFGNAPASEDDLIRTFLKDDQFIVMSPSDYNALGVGTTQLYNTRKVYNRKRHGTFRLGNRSFEFVRKFSVPRKLTKEFLLVDLVNNMKNLAEDQPNLWQNVGLKVKEMNQEKLKETVDEYGNIGTKKKFAELLK